MSTENRTADELGRVAAKNARLITMLDRMCDVVESFIRDSKDPESEAIAAIWCARLELYRG